ncbi:unnamed protein product [Ectocarpus sp. 12 AP-2014]
MHREERGMMIVLMRRGFGWHVAPGICLPDNLFCSDGVLCCLVVVPRWIDGQK